MEKVDNKKRLLLLGAIVLTALIPWQNNFLLLKTVIPLIILVFFYKISGTKLNEIGLSKPSKKTLWNGILVGFGVGLISTIAVRPLISLISGTRDVSQFDFIIGNPLMFIVALAFTWVFAAFAEEFIWRGFVLKSLLYFFKSDAITWQLVAIGLTSFVFAFLHIYQGIGGVLQVFIVSLIYCFVYIKFSNGLWVCVLAHGIGNTISFTLIFLDLYEYRNAINWL